MTAYPRQGDPQWAAMKLLDGDLTWGRAGCMFFSLVRVAVATGALEALISPLPDPREILKAAHDRIVAARGCAGSSLILPTAAGALGLMAPETERVRVGSVAGVLERLRKTMDADRRALLHVDHDSTRATGDPGGDHFIEVERLTPDGNVVCYDPATGEDVVLNGKFLDGKAGWGGRLYRATGIAPVWRAA